MTRPNLNAVALVPENLEAPIGSTGFHVLRAIGVLPEWLFYQVQNGAFVEAMSTAVQGVVYPAVRPKDVNAYRVSIAPIPEQRRIVAAIEEQFTRLDAAVSSLQRARANLKRYRASVLARAVEGRLINTQAVSTRGNARSFTSEELLALALVEPPDLANTFRHAEDAPTPAGGSARQYPGGWSSATIGQLATRVQYGTSAKTDGRAEGIPILRMGNIVDGRLRFEKLKYLPEDHVDLPGLMLEPGDILFNRTNSAELVGKSAVYRGQPNPCSFASYLIRVQLAPGYDPDYLVFYLNSTHGRAWVKSVVSQQVGQANVNGKKLQELVVPVPPIAEQLHIVQDAERRLSSVDEAEAAVNSSLKRAHRLRQTILKRAFEGQLVPQDPTDEPASALLERIRGERTSANGTVRPLRRRVSRVEQPTPAIQEPLPL